MKVILQSLLRAVCAIAIGAMLVKYRQDMVQWMTIAIGVLFFISGLAAIAMTYISKRKADKILQAVNETEQAEGATQDNPQRIRMSGAWGCGILTGLGSMLLGVVLALMPTTFVSFLIYILSAFLIIGAIQQFMSLAITSRIGSVGIIFWLMPTLLLIAGFVAVAYPEAIASAPLFFIGWCMMVYGVVECINGIKAYTCQKKADKQAATANTLDSKPDFSDAEPVDYEEIKNE